MRAISWFKAALIVVIVFIGSFGLGAASQFVFAQLFLSGGLAGWQYEPPAQTTLYTSDGKVLMTFGYEREYKDDFPALLKKAVVTMEDKRFYEHGGIDPKGMLRAVWTDVRLGKKAQGGSTITQQLARTLFLTNQKTLLRKSKEMVIAAALERKYSKDEILNMYLNEIYMGRGVCGMGAAAEKYFGKDVSRLNLAEISYLTAMIAAPEYYSPDHNAEALKKRQQVVLNLLAENGIITREEAAKAADKKLHIVAYEGRKVQHPYFTLYILDYLKNEYGEDAVYRGGLKVYTTMNSVMQTTAEKTVSRQAAQLAREGITARDCALVSVEPGTGAIRALVGGVDFSQNQVNMAVHPRQPGSSIKPLIYAAAIDEGVIDANTVLNNTPRDFGGGYKPKNMKSAPATATVRQALINSYNVASVEVLDMLGVKRAVRYLEAFGVTTITPDDFHLAMALGGLSKGISPLQMAAAYATLANGGEWCQPYFLERIEEPDGGVLYEHSPSTRQVISASAARTITSILRDVVNYGTGSSARLWIPSAGKTGTTTDSRDLWYVGYTSHLATAVWLGNSDNSAIKGAATWGGTRCGPIFRSYMNSLIEQGVLSTDGLGLGDGAGEAAATQEETAPADADENVDAGDGAATTEPADNGEAPGSEPSGNGESPDQGITVPGTDAGQGQGQGQSQEPGQGQVQGQQSQPPDTGAGL